MLVNHLIEVLSRLWDGEASLLPLLVLTKVPSFRPHDTQHKGLISDIQHNDTQHDNTRHNDTQHNDTEHNDTQHNDTQHNDTQHNDTQHNDTQHNDTLPLC
jgi:hypothetical protein